MKDENEVMNYVFAQEKLRLKTIIQHLISEQQEDIPESMGSQVWIGFNTLDAYQNRNKFINEIS